MNRLTINPGEICYIVIDQIIFVKAANSSTSQQHNLNSYYIVIDQIIFLKMNQGESIDFTTATLPATANDPLGLDILPPPPNASRGTDPNKLIVIDPIECSIYMDTNRLVVQKWIEVNGIKRRSFENYKITDLDILKITTDASTGKVILHLYKL